MTPQTPSSPHSLRVVVTGGPGSGKTTLIEALARRGFPTVPEAAIQVIEELCEEHGVEGQMAWRRAHRAAFQQAVLDRQIALEQAAGDPPVLFLDRGRLDGLAYCRHFGSEVTPAYVASAGSGRYDRILCLATLTGFDARVETGRGSDRDQSVALGRALAEVYREAGYDVLEVPELADAEARVELVLASLGLAGTARA